MSEIPKFTPEAIPSVDTEKEHKATFSQKIMEQARSLAHEILSQPEVTELLLPISEKGSLLLTLNGEKKTILEEFELEGNKFYIVLLNNADESE